MKYLLLGILAGSMLWAQAQPGGAQERHPNALLNQSFWQAQPGVEAIKAEVAKGHNPSESNAMAMDAVVMAINGGAPTESIIYLLEQKGNPVDKLTHDGRTYIFWAANRGNVEVMKYLLAKGAKVTIEDSHGMSPINFAAANGQLNTEVYELCLQNGANLKTDVNNAGANALLLAVGADSTFKLTEYFISKGLDLKSKDADGNTAFNYAARSGNVPAMKMLLSKGVAYTDNAMLMAAQGTRRGANKLEVFQYLESVGIKPTVKNKETGNALHAIVRRPGQTELVQYFLSKGVSVADVDEDGNTVLMSAAAANRDTATIALLTSLTKNINATNKAGATALALAVKGNSPEVVRHLIAKGAAINTVDAKGYNLAYYLFESYSPRQAKDFEAKMALLQSSGLDFKAPQGDGSTAYHLAVAKNNVALLKLVATLGVDVNAKNSEGFTALHKAAMMSKDDSVLQYLLAAGARKDVKTAFDETAYDLASENEYLSKQKVSVDFLK